MRSPCSFAVRMRAMTCGRLTRVSSSSSARSRASPSAVSASAATVAAGGAATAVGAAPPTLPVAVCAARPDGVSVQRAHPGHRRRRRRRPARCGSGAAAPRPARRSARRSGRSPCARPSRCAGSPRGGPRSGRGGLPGPPRGLPAAKAASSASSYSSIAAVAAHQTFSPSSERRVLSQCPPAAGRLSPSSVLAIAATRRATDTSDVPMYRTVCDGSQNDPRRAATAFDVGTSPSRRSVSTRSIHLPTRLNSIGADARGAGASTTKTPGPWAWTGRPQTAGPSAMRPTERRSEGALTSWVIDRWYR